MMKSTMIPITGARTLSLSLEPNICDDQVVLSLKS